MITLYLKIRKMGLGGYTEYHASQIGFAELLGASEVKNIKSFSMNDMCKTISGNKIIRFSLQERKQILFWRQLISI